MTLKKIFFILNLVCLALSLIYFLAMDLSYILSKLDARIIILLIYFGLPYAGVYVFYKFLIVTWDGSSVGRKAASIFFLTFSYAVMFIINDLLITGVLFEMENKSIIISILN